VIRQLRAHRRSKAAAALLPVKQALLAGHVMVGVDVGSAGGMQPHWRAYEGVVEFYCFEPHEQSLKKLQAQFAAHPSAGKFHVVGTGLSRDGGERTLYMLNCPTGSSLYPIDTAGEFVDANDDYIFPIREAKIQTRSLEDVLTAEAVQTVDIIKLDVQGAEREILEGLGEKRRRKLLLAEAEVNICGGVSRNFSPYAGAPTWKELDELFVADGMRLLDFSVARAYRSRSGDNDWYQRRFFDVYRNSPTISAHAWEADVVYVRDWRELIKNGDSSAIRKLVIALCGYRFFSEAMFIVEQSEQAGVLDGDSARQIKAGIVDWHRALRRPWHGRGRVWSAFRRALRASGVSQLLRWKQYMWFDYPHG
jgi:FkbM family methyltransferase